MDLRLVVFIIMRAPSSESGDAARDGPLGDVVRDRWSAGVDLVAAAAKAAALSFWCNMVVIKDRRVGRCARESTRLKKDLSSMLAFPLSSAESSQSEESSSSSIALSSTSSSSVSNTSSEYCWSSKVRVATSSWNEVCFFCAAGRPGVCDIALCVFCIFDGSELSSSLDDPPKWNVAFFFG